MLPKLFLEAVRTGTWLLDIQTDPVSRAAISRYEAWVTLSDGRSISTSSARPFQSLQQVPAGVHTLRFKATAERKGRVFTHTIVAKALVRAGETSETALRIFPRGLVEEAEGDGSEEADDEE